jgi:hypothetical protein
MDDERTIVVSDSRRKWTVYRIATSSSEYHLGIFAGGTGRRRCAVLRGRSSQGNSVSAEDTNPLIGNTSLFDVPPAEWLGARLDIGTTRTSAVRSVELEEDPAVIHFMTRPLTNVALAEDSPRPSERRLYAATRAAYPEDCIEQTELAAKCLTAVYAKNELLHDLKSQAELRRRFELAMGECFLLIKAMGTRISKQ